MLHIIKLFITIILDRNPKTKILSNSPNDGMLRFANISLATLFFKAVLVQSNHIGAQYTGCAKKKERHFKHTYKI